MRHFRTFCLAGAAGLALASAASAQSGVAPGAPGAPPVWSSAAKTGAGASYEAYVDCQYRDGGPTGAVSKVWYSIADGVLTETMYGLIHEAQIKALRFAGVTQDGLVVEGDDTTSRTDFNRAVEAAQLADAVIYPILVVPITNNAGRNIGGDHQRNPVFLKIIQQALALFLWHIAAE